MDILKKNSISKQPVLLSLGSRNNSILNKIKSNIITPNTNLNMLKVIKNKNKNIKNKIIYSKKNFQTNSNSINKHIEQNNKEKLSNKFLSRVFSYRKIEKNNGGKKEQKIKNKDEENIDVPINNNVTNNITNNITNIFINNDNKKKEKKINNKNLSEKNKKNIKKN